MKEFKYNKDEFFCRLYHDEMPTGELTHISRAMASGYFGNFLNIPSMLWKEQYQNALSSLPWERFRDQFAEACARGFSKCESPLEKMILPWLLQAQYQFFDYNPTVLFAGETDQYVAGTIAVIPQLTIGKYRADFALAGSLGGLIKFVVVECDGKEFHEGDEHKKRDAIRDREMMKNSRVLDVVRISSNWIMDNPQQAAWFAAKRVLEAWRKK